jgi:hypothetical protein
VTERVAFLTITPPGDREHVDTRTGKVCRCTPPGGVHLARWHGEKGVNFTHFVRDLRRMMGPRDDVQYFRGVERFKRRAALHDHLLVRCRGDLVAKKEAVRRLAIKHGFGHSIDLRWARPGDEGYVAKYVTDSVDHRAEVMWLDVATGELTRGARCRTWTATRRWGPAMKELRAQQVAWARQRDAERVAGVQARQGDASHPLPFPAGAADVCPLDSYTASYPSPGSAPVDGRGW